VQNEQDPPRRIAEITDVPPDTSTRRPEEFTPPSLKLPEDSLEAMAEIKRVALESAEKLAESFPKNCEAVAVSALACGRFGESDEVARRWQECLQLNPNFADAYHGLADLALQKGDYQQAAAMARRALEINPHWPGIHAMLGESLMGMGEMEDAARVFRQGLEHFPDSTELHFRLGQACFELNRYEEARSAHQQAIRRDPHCTYAYYGLAKACTRLGLADEARDQLEQFRKCKDADRQAEKKRLAAFDDLAEVRQSAAFLHMAIAEVYRRLDVRDSAEEHLLRTVALHPENPANRQSLAALYQQHGRLQEAVAVMHSLCRLQPDDAGSMLRLGVLQVQQGDLSAAERTFQTTIERNPDVTAGYVALAQLWMQSGQRLVEARDLARRAVSMEPSAPHYYLLSAVSHAVGDQSAAVEAIRKAVELAPENSEYQRILSSLEGRP
jgi:tetratricopeptide (TPR) repeat protein